MTVLTIDSDLITFFRLAVWTGGIFLAVYALIGVVFFGWDVAKARATLKDAEKEVRDQVKELRADFRNLKELKEKLEELGAQLEETADAVDEKKQRGQPRQQPEGPAGLHPPQPSPPPQPHASDADLHLAATTRSDLDLMRQVLASSNFEWTTITRLMKKTGLAREQVLSTARAAPDIVISFGKRTKDHILKLKGG